MSKSIDEIQQQMWLAATLNAENKLGYRVLDAHMAAIYQALAKEAKPYDVVTHDFGTPQVIATDQAIPLAKIKELFNVED